jgi:hypothetical protein
MQLIIYQVTNEDLHQQGEQLELVACSEAAPQVGDLISMGSDRPWQIVHTETYQADDSRIHLAFTAPIGESRRKEWGINQIKQEHPQLSFYILLKDKEIETWGWAMDGKAPSGMLYDYAPAPIEGTTLMKPLETGLFVDWVKTHHGGETYNAIHLCGCAEIVVAA